MLGFDGGKRDTSSTDAYSMLAETAICCSTLERAKHLSW